MTQNSDILRKNIFVELGLQDLAKDRKLDLLSKMSDLIQKRVLLRAIKSLSVAEKEEFDKLLGKDNAQDVYRYLISKVPNIDQITDEEVIAFKDEVVEKVKSLNL
jgi:succinate dehydrogenase flavin-adding protein (antitoxin of CptAB toxin-antitoxin module)